MAVCSAKCVHQVFSICTTLGCHFLDGCDVCFLLQSLTVCQFLLVRITSGFHTFLCTLATSEVGNALGHVGACALYVDLVEGVIGSECIQCVVCLASCLNDVADVGEIAADVTRVERVQESLIQSFGGLHRASPFVQLFLVVEKGILGD